MVLVLELEGKSCDGAFRDGVAVAVYCAIYDLCKRMLAERKREIKSGSSCIYEGGVRLT